LCGHLWHSQGGIIRSGKPCRKSQDLSPQCLQSFKQNIHSSLAGYVKQGDARNILEKSTHPRVDASVFLAQRHTGSTRDVAQTNRFVKCNDNTAAKNATSFLALSELRFDLLACGLTAHDLFGNSHSGQGKRYHVRFGSARLGSSNIQQCTYR
jgi:hypothetical protein